MTRASHAWLLSSFVRECNVPNRLCALLRMQTMIETAGAGPTAGLSHIAMRRLAYLRDELGGRRDQLTFRILFGPGGMER